MEQWKKAWGYVPINHGTQVGILEDQTQKVWIRNNLNGTEVKVKFTNLYSMDTLLLDHVTVGKWDRVTKKITQIKEVTSRGQKRILVLPEDSFYSDSIPFPIKATEDIVVSVYFDNRYKVCSVCQTWNATGWKSSFMEGDQCGSSDFQGKRTVEVLPFFRQDIHECNAAVGISGVKVLAGEEVKTVACFGDSITHMSYYFDPLQEKLFQKFPGRITLLNCGIGGNRILYDACYVKDIPGNGKCFGDAGVARFEQDIYEDTVPDIIFFMEGVNDCTHGFAFGLPEEVPTGEKLFNGILRMAGKAHEKGSKIYISTVMPFGCYEETFRGPAEKIRQDLNALLREHQKEVDGFVDLDQIMRKPEDVHFMKDGMHLGDGVHLNEAGGREVAAAIVERLF